MSSRITKPNLDEMDSILNKELQNLGARTYTSPVYYSKENMSLLARSDLQKSAPSLPHHSRKSSNAGDRSPRVTFKDQYQTNIEEKHDPNVNMQKELINLQTKVLELEMKISSVTSTTLQNKNYDDNRSSITNTFDTSKVNSIQVSPSARMTKELELKSSMRSTIDRRHTPNLRISPILEQDQFEASRTLPDEYSKILVRSPSGLSCYTTKSNTRKTLKENDSHRYQSNILRESHSTWRSTSKASLLSSSAKYSKRESYTEAQDDGLYLSKQIKILRREYDDDRAALVKERVKGKELKEELNKCMKKFNKLEQSLKTATNAQTGYVDLIESFDKSEDIRKQQRRMIERLNDELRFLKGDHETSKNEFSVDYKAPISINKKLRQKSKKKTIKTF